MTLPSLAPTIRTWLAVGLTVVSMMAMTLPAFAVEQGGIGGRPAHPKAANSRSQSIFVHTLNPGQQTKDGVQVINNTPQTKTILVYAVDSQVSSGGAFACAQAADKPLSVGSWITLDKKEVTLTTGGKQVVDFTIKVPKNASPGEHNGCIVIQDTKQQKSPDSNGIVLSLRSAIRVAIRVPGDIQKGLAFTGLGMDPKGEEKLLLSAALKNNGNVSLDTQLNVKLRYWFGLAAETAGGSFPVLASSEGRYNFETSRPFWGGWYRLAATAQYNDDPNVSLGEGKPTAGLQQSKWVYIAPDPLAAILQVTILASLLGLAVWWTLRRKQHRRALHRARTHIVKPGENLHTIAETHGMPWKRLARLNNLKPPYQLKPGQSLLVTPATEQTGRSSHKNKRPFQKRPD
jgi:hypothetical protein